MNPPWSYLWEWCERDFCVQTRIHELRTFSSDTCQVYVKREDESGFGISGCKKRKYASLFPFLHKHNYQEVALIGGAHSNHVAGMLQVLNERNFTTHLFLKQAHNPSRTGNRFLIDLLGQEPFIKWLTAGEWPQAEKRAREFFQQAGIHGYVIPEGGSCGPAWAGACTLMHDIIRNEEEGGLAFDHIFIDAGTGFMAASLIWMNALLQRSSQIHVILLAGDKQSFHQQMNNTYPYFPIPLQDQLPEHSPRLYNPFPRYSKSLWKCEPNP